MSLVTKNFKVEFIASDTDTVTDITAHVVSIDEVALQSTGIISDAKITLNAEFGAFITATNDGATPLIELLDRIRITVIGDDGTTTQSKIFEVTTRLDQLATSSSHYLPLELQGRERNLSGVPFSGIWRALSHYELLEQIIFGYNEQKGTRQPTLFLSTDSTVPRFNPNIWDFTNVDNCFDSLLFLIDSLDLPVSAGGGGNRYALIFEDDSTNLNNLIVKIIIQGTANSALDTPPSLEQNTANPITKIDKIKQAITGTLKVARGRPKTATLPTNYTHFTSRLEFYKLIKDYDASIAYPAGAYVSLGGNTYFTNSAIPINTPPPQSPWVAINVGNYIGVFDYNPLFKNRLTQFKNGLANPTAPLVTNSSTGFNHLAIPDYNLTINDKSLSDFTIGTHRQTAKFRCKSVYQNDLTTRQKNYMFKLAGNLFGFYDGFQILIDNDLAGTLEPPFDGTDRNGRTYINSVCQFVATPNIAIVAAQGGSITPGGEWVVVRSVQLYDQCAIWDEGIIYEYNHMNADPNDRIYPGADRRRGSTSNLLGWRNISGFFLGNDCFHHPSSIEQVDGLFGDVLEQSEPLNDSNGMPYKQNSGIKITYGFNESSETPSQRSVWFSIYRKIITGDPITKFLVNLVSNVFNTFATPNYTRLGWWFAWSTPYPHNTQSITENIGEIYGGDRATLNRHPYFEMFNIQYTPTGKQGWTHSDSPNLMELTGVRFLFHFDTRVSNNRIPYSGDIPFTYWCMDKFGTKWKSKKVMYRHLGETQPVEIEFGDLTPVFFARTPLGIGNILENAVVPEREMNAQFFKESVTVQGFQCEASYDDHGRYAPNLWESIVKPSFFDVFFGGAGNIEFAGIIDAYAFIKTPIAISVADAVSAQRVIIPQFVDFPNIVNVQQLQRFADSAAQVDRFPYEQFTVAQGGVNDLSLEDSIILKDGYLISESDSGTNSRLLAVREIHYAVPEQGGLIRTLVGVKVIDT